MQKPTIHETIPQRCDKCGLDLGDAKRGIFCGFPLNADGTCKSPLTTDVTCKDNVTTCDWHDEHMHVTCSACGFKWLVRPADYSKRKLEESRVAKSTTGMFSTPISMPQFVPPVLYINGKRTSLVLNRKKLTMDKQPDEYYFVGVLGDVSAPDCETIARCDKCKTFAVGSAVQIREGQYHCGGDYNGKGYFKLYKLLPMTTVSFAPTPDVDYNQPCELGTMTATQARRIADYYARLHSDLVSEVSEAYVFYCDTCDFVLDSVTALGSVCPRSGCLGIIRRYPLVVSALPLFCDRCGKQPEYQRTMPQFDDGGARATRQLTISREPKIGDACLRCTFGKLASETVEIAFECDKCESIIRWCSTPGAYRGSTCQRGTYAQANKCGGTYRKIKIVRAAQEW